MQAGYIYFSCKVNDDFAAALITTVVSMHESGVDNITLLLSTTGGSVMDGINVYNVFRALPINLETHNVGSVEFIGNVIFAAGKRRYACSHSIFMFHGVSWTAANDAVLDAKALGERLELVKSDNKRIGAIIGDHTSLKGEELDQLFTGDRFKDPVWAKDVGFINEICDPVLPAGVQLHNIVK